MNGAELTRRPLPSCAGQPWTTVVEATRGPGGAPEQGLQGCSRPRSAALPEEWMQEGDRSLVCVQTENPGPATRPCCVRCWVCRGEVNAFSFPSPAPWHCVHRAESHSRAARGHTDVRRSSACPSLRVCRVENLVAPPTIQEPSCSLPGVCVLVPQPCPLPWDATCPPGWVPAGLERAQEVRDVCGSQSCQRREPALRSEGTNQQFTFSRFLQKKKSTDKEMILTFVAKEESKLLLCLVI